MFVAPPLSLNKREDVPPPLNQLNAPVPLFVKISDVLASLPWLLMVTIPGLPVAPPVTCT
jgi:hypothetical protein